MNGRRGVDLDRDTSAVSSASRRTTQSVIGISIDVVSWDDAIARIADWASRRESRYVCICNAHSVVTARTDPRFARVLDEADMATADGTPVAWMLRRLGYRDQKRINGPDLMWRYCEQAAKRGEAVFLLGARPEVLGLLERRLCAELPGLVIAGTYSPPFRPLTPEEDAEVVATINASGAGVVWVGLGCPKQELWMADHRGRIEAVMIGVGAAFDFHAGTVARAPRWMRENGLEWVHRIWSEPRRLWKRYAITNTLFLLYAMRQLLFRRAK